MALTRRLLLAASTNPWLRGQAMRRRFIRRSVSRFMPGEHVEDALAAARSLAQQGITTILTHLGENLERVEEAEAVTRHYLDVLDRVAAAGLDAQISIKPTQLGLDLDAALCQRNLDRLLDRAEQRGNFVWVDMESSPYVDPTLALFRSSRARSPRVGIALQSYLYRTEADVEALMPIGAAIRLVKGAYLEPREVAYPKKRDVDEQFVRLSCRLLVKNVAPGSLLHIGTHDAALTERLLAFIDAKGIPRSAYEFAMLYGIQRAQQRRLRAAGRPLRVLISYGEHWFPWYMRRLAERPANMWFVAKNMFG
jgi:proline dehydrogenase